MLVEVSPVGSEGKDDTSLESSYLEERAGIHWGHGANLIDGAGAPLYASPNL